MRSRRIRSISVPITFGAVTVPMAAALTVGWTVFLMARITESGEVVANVWLLVLGLLAFVVIMTVLTLFTILLAREIIEVRRQDSFIDSVTHELKSPLASLKLCLQTLEREGISEAKRVELRAMMGDDLDRLASFIDDVLRANRLAHGEYGIELEEVDVHLLLRRVIASIETRQRLPEGSVTCEVAEGTRWVSDRVSLEIIARNLIDNAVKYSPAPPHIRVSIARSGRFVVLKVEDQGIGIARAELRRVFQRFYRGGTEAVKRRKGTGLGLFVVSALVRNLGGRVEADSPGEGRGSTFTVTLPASPRG